MKSAIFTELFLASLFYKMISNPYRLDLCVDSHFLAYFHDCAAKAAKCSSLLHNNRFPADANVFCDPFIQRLCITCID